VVAYRANTTAESPGVEEDKGSTPSKRFPAANQFKNFRTAFQQKSSQKWTKQPNKHTLIP
jgi:hypothetical protein